MTENKPVEGDEKILYWGICGVLIILAGLCSGLNVSIFSLRLELLHSLTYSGSSCQKILARRLLWIRRQNHFTLVTLLVSNALAMTALPVFLERLVSPTVAIVLSVTAVLFFGEVIPQALFVRFNFEICGALTPLIWVLMLLTSIISFPLAKLLDCVVGESRERYGRKRITAAIQELVDAQRAGCGDVVDAEIAIMRSALALTTKTVAELSIVPPSEVFSVTVNEVLKRERILELAHRNFSRIPVMGENGQVVGVLLLKALLHFITSPTADRVTVADLPLCDALQLSTHCSISEAFKQFRRGHCHLAAVYRPGDVLVGFVSLDDVVRFVHRTTERDLHSVPQAEPSRRTLRQQQVRYTFDVVRKKR